MESIEGFETKVKEQGLWIELDRVLRKAYEEFYFKENEIVQEAIRASKEDGMGRILVMKQEVKPVLDGSAKPIDHENIGFVLYGSIRIEKTDKFKGVALANGNLYPPDVLVKDIL